MSDRWTVSEEERGRILAAMDDPAVQQPDWHACTHVHDWRAYVSAALAQAWPTLSPWVRSAIYVGCETQADNEEWD